MRHRFVPRIAQRRVRNAPAQRSVRHGIHWYNNIITAEVLAKLFARVLGTAGIPLAGLYSAVQRSYTASEGRVVLVLLAKYPLDRLGTILGATFCERFDQTGRAVLHRLRGYRRSAELLTLARRNLSRVGTVLRAARRLAAVPAAAARDNTA